jgi:hypothetical protein
MTDLSKLSNAVRQISQPEAPLELRGGTGDDGILATARNSFAGFVATLRNLLGLTSASQRSASAALIDAVYAKASANIGDNPKSRLLAAKVLASENVKAGRAISAKQILQSEAKLEALTRAQKLIDSVIDLKAGLKNPQSYLYQSTTNALIEITEENAALTEGDIGEWISHVEWAVNNPEASVKDLGASPLHPTDFRREIVVDAQRHSVGVPEYESHPLRKMISAQTFENFSSQVEVGAKVLLAQLEKKPLSANEVDEAYAKFEAGLKKIVDTQVQHVFENALFQNIGSPHDAGIEFKYHVDGPLYHKVLQELGIQSSDFDQTPFDPIDYQKLLGREVGYLTAIQGGKSPSLKEIHQLAKGLLLDYKQACIVEKRSFLNPLAINEGWNKKLLQERALIKSDLAACKTPEEVLKVKEQFTARRIELGIECQNLKAYTPGDLHHLRFENDFELALKIEIDNRLAQLS